MFGVSTNATVGKKNGEVIYHKEFRGLYNANGGIYGNGGILKDSIKRAITNSIV